MMFKKNKITSRLLILAIVFLLSFTALALANTEPEISRLAGYDRYETATQIAKAGWTESEYAVLAYGENYPDALASAPLARKYDAPILLTTSNSLPETTKQTLHDLNVKNVIVIGGTGVIFAPVDAELEVMGLSVTRVYGYDQYETAVEVARQLGSPSELFVVTGEDFPDALSVASIAGIKQMPIILTPKDTVPDSVKSYIATLNINKSYVIGDTNIISDEVSEQFSNVERILGADKYARNIAINQKFADEFTSNGLCLATGEIFADALTGTAYTVKLAAPIVLVNNNPSTVTKSYCQDMADKAGNVYVFGGTGIIPERVIQDLYNTEPEPGTSGTKMLVAYFSRTGNTETIARYIQEFTGGDLFEIVPINPYPADYNECLAQAKRELAEDFRPELTAHVDNMSEYDVVFIGYPIWYGDAPMIIRSFLEEYDLNDKVVVPFCTHGGSGISGSLPAIESLCSGSTILEGLGIRSSDVGNARNNVQAWLDGLGLDEYTNELANNKGTPDANPVVYRTDDISPEGIISFLPTSAAPTMSDIAILASLDPVALDKACVDLVYAAPDGRDLIQRIESRNGAHTLDHAAKIGLGSLSYRLVSIDAWYT